MSPNGTFEADHITLDSVLSRIQALVDSDFFPMTHITRLPNDLFFREQITDRADTLVLPKGNLDVLYHTSVSNNHGALVVLVHNGYDSDRWRFVKEGGNETGCVVGFFLPLSHPDRPDYLPDLGPTILIEEDSGVIISKSAESANDAIIEILSALILSSE